MEGSEYLLACRVASEADCNTSVIALVRLYSDAKSAARRRGAGVATAGVAPNGVRVYLCFWAEIGAAVAHGSHKVWDRGGVVWCWQTFRPAPARPPPGPRPAPARPRRS